MTDDSPDPADPAHPLRSLRPAKGAAPWLVPAVVGTAATALAATRNRRWYAVAAPAALATTAMTWFFRDPPRDPGTGRLLAAADGVVQSVDALDDGRHRIATFMSPLNVHVNRAPAAAVVRSMRHRPGGHLPAFNKDSERNERVVWHLETEFGDVELVQIAGTMARRIVPYLGVDEKVERAGRIGLIRFGSRVDVYLPAGLSPALSVGDRTLAGRTRLDRD